MWWPFSRSITSRRTRASSWQATSSRRDQRSSRIVQRREAGPGGRAHDDPGRRSDRRAEENDHRPRPASASLPRVAVAAVSRPRRRRDGRVVECARRRQEFTPVPASRVQTRRLHRTSTPASSPRRCRRSLSSRRRRGPATRRTRSRRSSTRKLRSSSASRRRSTKCSARSTSSRLFYGRMEEIAGKADQLNSYFIRTGDPDYFNEDVARYRSLSPSDIRAAALAFLPPPRAWN